MNEPDKREDLSDAVEDAFGFNFRSVKTLVDLFVRPRRVFQSYAARDRITYTPAIRIFFALIGLQVLASTLWGGWESMFARQIETSDPSYRLQLEQIADSADLGPFIKHYADAANFMHPILVALFTSFSVFVLGWLRPQLAWPSRMNIAMGVMTAGTFVGILCMPFSTAPNFQAWVWLGTLVVTIAYFITIFRGGRGIIADSSGGLWVKSTIYTLALLFLIILSGAVLVLICTAYAVFLLQ